MKCCCKLPGKHHHELWYTLSGFHIVRLPLASQLGLYILSWKQFGVSYFLFSSDFSLCKFASFFLIILVRMHLLLLFDASFSLFLLFVHVCGLLILLSWPPSVHAPCQHPLSKVNKCMCTLVGCHHTQTPKGAKPPPHLNQRLKKTQKRKVKEEKISKLRQTQSPEGKTWHVYWLVFCNVCDLPLRPPPPTTTTSI